MKSVIPYFKVVSSMVLGCLGQRGFKQPAVKHRPNANTGKQKAFCPLPSAFWLLVLITPSAVRAQIVPDNTLPVNSQVTGCPVCTIDGGTIRGVNLFHSFQEFGVPTGGEAFFNNGLDIENILGRVTGTNISDIDGWIRANGTANLFLINPNGIVFGENARLDVGGSFVGSTANALGFGNQGVFSATEPEAPPLLTVNPDVLFFNQLAAQGVSSIEVRGSLSVLSGESLLLVGGNVAPDATTTGEVLIDGGTLTAPGGRVELAGVGAPGEVGLVVEQGSLGLNFPADLVRTDISIFGSTIDVREAGGGDIVISPRDLSIENSQLFAGIASGFGSVDAQAGDITIDATGTVAVAEGVIRNNVEAGAIGRGGDVQITGSSVSLTNGAQIGTSTRGEGDAGKVVIRAMDSILLDGEDSQGRVSGVGNQVNRGAKGNSGGVEIESGSLSVTNGAFISGSTFGEGNAGKVVIRATDSILLDGESRQGFRSAVFNQVNRGAKGNSGGVEIESGSLSVTNRARINASTLGEGDAGKVVIQATDNVLFDGENSQGFRSAVFSRVNSEAQGDSGGVEIESGSLSLTNGAFINASTWGEGNAGKVVIRVTDSILLDGEDSQGFGSSIGSQVAPGAKGNSEGVEIESSSLSLMNGTRIDASTLGEGDAGKVVIRATDSILLDGENTQEFVSSIGSQVAPGAKGNSGGVEIESGSLSLTNGAGISSSTRGEGDAGKVVIRATDNVLLDGESTQGFLSLVFSTVELEAKGNSGGVEIESGSLSLTNGAQISASTWGEGDAGKVVIRATDNVFLDGESTQGFLSSVLSGVTPEAQGNSRGVEIESGSLSLTNGARISAETRSTGMAGDVRINATDFIQLSGDSTIRANSTAGGSAGDITLTTPELTLQNDANIATTTESSGKAGTITLQSHPNQENLTLNLAQGTSISASTDSPFNQATGGNIKIKAPDAITIQGEGTITTETAGAAQAGNIEITSTDLNIQQTELSSSTTGEGNAGEITLDTSTLTLARGAKIFAFTDGSGDSGTIEINAPTEVNLGIGVDDFSPVLSVETSRAGKAGNIIINTPTLTLSDTARITATATDTATNTEGGGSITLNASTMNLAGIVGVFAETEGQTPAGTLTLNPYLDESTLDITLAPNSQVSASTSGSGTGGNLILSAPQAITIAGQGRLAVESRSTGDAGNVLVTTPQLTLTDGVELSAAATDSGNAGEVRLNTQQLTLENDAKILASNSFSRSEGIILEGLDTLRVSNNSAISASTQTGEAGSLTINANSNPANLVQVSDNSRLSVEATGEGGIAGGVTINTEQLNLNARSQLSASNISGESQDIILQGLENIQLTNGSEISASTQTGTAGSLSINQGENPVESVSVSNSNLSVAATGEGGKAGGVTINTEQLSLNARSQLSASNISGESQDIILQGLENVQLTNNSEISASTETGTAGSLSINASENPVESVSVNNSRLSVAATGEGGKAGGVTINTEQLSLNARSQLSASNISGESQDIILQGLENIQLTNNSEISASTQTGTAGSLSINAGENPVESVSLNNSRLSVEATSEGGKAGGVTINTEQLSLNARSQISASNISGESQDIILQGLENVQLTNGSEISASTQTGTAGSLSINAGENPVESVSVSNSNLSVAATGEGGKAGGVTINTEQLSLNARSQLSASNISGESQDIILQGLENVQLTNGSEISASTQTGTAGSLSINAGENPVESVSLNNSRLSVEATSEGGKAGGVTINTEQLTLEERSQLSASNISGESQDIILQGLENVQLTNGSEISASTQTGTAGSLSINAGENPVESVSLNNSRLSVEATGEGGKAGGVTINTEQLSLNARSQLSASNISGISEDITLQGLDTLTVNNSQISASTQRGKAGSLTVNASDSVDLNGEGGLSVEATQGGTAGDLTVETGRMSVQDGASVTVSSPSGQAGNLAIAANFLFLNQGKLTAETALSDAAGGANIFLTGLDFLYLANESLISANAFDLANGGNITINSLFIVATSPTGKHGSDITANADQGNGGAIGITTQGLFGIEFRPQLTPQNDITVSSEFGLSGRFELNSPNVDPSRGLLNLPSQFVDASRQMRQNCPARRSGQENRFVVTGTGGLPPRPGDSIDSPFPTGEVRSLPSSSVSHNAPGKAEVTENVEPANRTQIIEATGWVRNDKGEVILVASDPTTPQNGSTSATCTDAVGTR